MRIDIIIHSCEEEALDALRRAVARHRQEGHEVRGRITFETGDAERFAQEAVTSGADLVIAGGGDGTVNAVVNGLFAGGAVSDPAELPRLGIVPLGTANDLALSLGVPEEVEAAVQLAVSAPPQLVDVARVNDRYFLNVSSGGQGAEVTDETSSRAKRVLGVAAYVASGVRKLAALETCRARFSSGDEVIHDGSFTFFAVGNAWQTGGGNRVTPRSDLADGLLDVCIILPVSHGELMRLLPGIRRGEHLESEHVIYRQLPELSVTSSEELPVNADGEPIEGSAFRYERIRRALRLAVPTRSPA